MMSNQKNNIQYYIEVCSNSIKLLLNEKTNLLQDKSKFLNDLKDVLSSKDDDKTKHNKLINILRAIINDI